MSEKDDDIEIPPGMLSVCYQNAGFGHVLFKGDVKIYRCEHTMSESVKILDFLRNEGIISMLETAIDKYNKQGSNNEMP